jgi:hypothetical protein
VLSPLLCLQALSTQQQQQLAVRLQQVRHQMPADLALTSVLCFLLICLQALSTQQQQLLAVRLHHVGHQICLLTLL